MVTLQDYLSYCSAVLTGLGYTASIWRTFPVVKSWDTVPAYIVTPVRRPLVEPIAFTSDSQSPYGHYELDYTIQLLRVMSSSFDNYTPVANAHFADRVIDALMRNRIGLPNGTYDVLVSEAFDYDRSKLPTGYLYTLVQARFLVVQTTNTPALY